MVWCAALFVAWDAPDREGKQQKRDVFHAPKVLPFSRILYKLLILQVFLFFHCNFFTGNLWEFSWGFSRNWIGPQGRLNVSVKRWEALKCRLDYCDAVTSSEDGGTEIASDSSATRDCISPWVSEEDEEDCLYVKCWGGSRKNNQQPP